MLKEKTLLKICGITTIDQAISIAELGVDAIGIISVKESPRYINQLEKKRIFETLANSFPKIKRVSVVKNILYEDLFKDLTTNNTNVLQLHGDESIEYCKKIKEELPNIDLWKAFRIQTKNDLQRINYYENFIDAILLDSWNQETYGGTGKRIDYQNLVNINFTKPWWLAGGVSSEWTDQIIRKIRPNGLDISSSVEIKPGIKDIKKIKLLLRSIKNNYL